MAHSIQDLTYRCPSDLTVSPTYIRNVLIVGSCLMSAWPKFIEDTAEGCSVDFFVFNNDAQLPDLPPKEVSKYDFQIVQIPLRSVVPDASYFRLKHDDLGAYEDLFLDAKDRLRRMLANAMRWNTNHGILAFVLNFLPPQQNPMGRLMPRYDLRNFVYFVERLNEALAEELTNYKNSFLFDFDQLIAAFGRKYFQDDVLFHLSHAGALSNSDFAHDQERLEPVVRANEIYPVRIQHFLGLAWAELVAMYRTVLQLDVVKLVIVDIDDTLWRGVGAEKTEFSANDIEGWPLGVIEALCYLKRRGVLLAVVSKNTEERVQQIWPKIIGQRLSMDDFVAAKINWRSKADNVEEILSEVNLLPQNVVFIDDNPVEREAVVTALPAIRTFGPNPYLWRRILLWSAETQVPVITTESAHRTDMVRAQITREVQRKTLSREEFLASLSLEVALFPIESTDHPRFGRAFELVNKTNQFNTTGRRWTRQECEGLFADGGRLCAFEVTDKFTNYGLVGVLVIRATTIEQFVMSCRVIGMDVELAAISEILRQMENHEVIEAMLEETPLNLLCRDLYQRCGFEQASATCWRSTSNRLSTPAHIQLTPQARDPYLGSSFVHSPVDLSAAKLVEPV